VGGIFGGRVMVVGGEGALFGVGWHFWAGVVLDEVCEVELVLCVACWWLFLLHWC
jgi:hypothetical protein